MNDSPSITRLATGLGYAGLLPFLAGTGATFVSDPTVSGPGLYALTIYAAVIVSFMGAVHWGVALAAENRHAAAQLGLGVLPALLGWAAIAALPPHQALAAIGVLFVLVLGGDVAAYRGGLLPRWYLRLRVPLTAIVCAALWTAAWSVVR